ncbi:5, 10-methylenetetrahydrofolate reductase related protein [Thermoplasma acidophilum]|uniref:5, 10-methylenetetrahydrofolate reductase related protein n=2 Tax=Thermoplasma acidophilum TaxID=2303 RepID=Q9HJI8_THEAC|nr:5, 10-methylenetetrahydrofolate reductase related protein [Thermoplasma acidophilum]
MLNRRKEMLSSSIGSLNFVKSVEIVPSRNFGTDDLIAAADMLDGRVNALTCPENPRGSPGIDPIMALYIISNERNIIPVPHITPRDKNRVHILSQIETAQKVGIRNFFTIGGDPINPKYESREVREIDVMEIIRMIKGRENAIVGAALNPYRDVEPEIVGAKIKSGADFFISQAVYSAEYLQKDWIKKRNFKLIAGFLPLTKKSQVKFSENLGIVIPDSVKQRLLNSEDVISTSMKIITEVFDEVKEYVDGIHIMPLGHNEIAAQILETI